MAAAIGIAKTATEIFLGVGEVSIDNLTFKLHYKWSVTLFVVCSVLVQTSQFFGDPVQCETVSSTWILGLLSLLHTTVFEITEKVSFIIASEASYIYISRGQKFNKNATNAHFGEFLKPEACGQTVLPDRSVLIGHKLVENAQITKFKCDILSDFKTQFLKITQNVAFVILNFGIFQQFLSY